MDKTIDEKVKRMKSISKLENIVIELEKWEPGKPVSKGLQKEVGDLNNIETRDKWVALLNNSIQLIKETKVDDNKLYLSEIIVRDKVTFGSNNLILAPVGSGKTHLIENVLLKGKSGKILLLVSNTALKNSVCPDNNEIRAKLNNNMYTTRNKKIFGDKDYEIHTMTYHEFGSKISLQDDFANQFSQIYCDEIHSLPEYEEYSKNKGLIHAIKYLFNRHENIQKFYFTATFENLGRLEQREPGTLRNVTIYDYREHPEIKRYIALSEYKITQLKQIRPHLRARKESFKYFGYKCLAYNRTISGQKKIEQIAKEEGFTPITIWSINNNNSEYQMTDEQLACREHLLIYGTIPEPYNFLIINNAMQEGWNLYDENVKLAIINTTNETSFTQSLGRLRNDLDVLIYRTTREDVSDLVLDVPDEYINTPLDSELKDKLCIELGVINNAGKISKWGVISKRLIAQGYKIKNSTKTINKKRTRVSTITKDF